MRRASKAAIKDSSKAKGRVASPGPERELLKRIRQRREEIRKRTGTLSDSTPLIREERDR